MPNPIIKVEYTTGRGQNYPVVSTIASPPAASVYGVTQGQLSAAYTSIVNLVFPTGAVGSAVTAKATIPLTTWPKSLTLAVGQSSIIVPTISVAATQPDFLFGLPYCVLTFGSGSPLQTSGTSTSIYTLQPGRTYKSPSLTFSITALVIASYPNPVSVPFSVSVVLLSATS